MISQLRGILLEIDPPMLLIEVNGVGYEVEVPLTIQSYLPSKGKEAILYTHLVIREDAHCLFGFAHLSERGLFKDLLKVNGVGPKLALAILSHFEPNAFVHCVLTNDLNGLVGIPGVGKKTAERLMLDMRDRLKNWTNIGDSSMAIDPKTSITPSSGISSNTIIHEAVSALITLGYKPQAASQAVSKVHQPGQTSEELIRLALKQ
jgi:Holliday junction DNA helicase RuvA